MFPKKVFMNPNRALNLSTMNVNEHIVLKFHVTVVFLDSISCSFFSTDCKWVLIISHISTRRSRISDIIRREKRSRMTRQSKEGNLLRVRTTFLKQQIRLSEFIPNIPKQHLLYLLKMYLGVIKRMRLFWEDGAWILAGIFYVFSSVFFYSIIQIICVYWYIKHIVFF